MKPLLSLCGLSLAFHAVFASCLHAQAGIRGQAFMVPAPEKEGPPKSVGTSNLNPEIKPTGDLIVFGNGDKLHGKLRSLDPTEGLQLEREGSTHLLHFPYRDISKITRERQTSDAKPKPALVRVQCLNQDKLLGTLLELNEETLKLDTFFAGSITLDRKCIQSIHFQEKVDPKDDLFANLEEWIMSPKDDQAWTYEDRVLTATKGGSLSRNLKIPASFKLEFDYENSNGAGPGFSLKLGTGDPAKEGDKAFGLTLARSTIHVDIRSGAWSFGSSYSGNNTPSKGRFQLTYNPKSGECQMSINGKNIWQNEIASHVEKLPDSGFILMADSTATMKFSNFQLSEWDGRSGSPVVLDSTPSLSTTENILALRNNDRITGKVTGIKDGKLCVTTSIAPIQIELDQIRTFYFPKEISGTEAPVNYWKAELADTSTLSLELKSWNNDQLVCVSPAFGEFRMKSEAIRNLRLPSPASKSIPKPDAPSVK